MAAGHGSTWRILILFSLLAVLAGCAQLPTDIPRTTSTALEDYRSTALAQFIAPDEAANPGKSGFALLPRPDRAFNSRLVLIDIAEKTLDLQVYIWEPDDTGLIIAQHVAQAAERGVRVRLLVDDLGFGGKDEGIAALDAHPNIEVRLFNPFANRSSTITDYLFDTGRVNHRMHNKMLIADNSIAVVGGRNIGNDYFGVHTESNFRDLDIGAVGPVVRDISRTFDHFWNNANAVPVSALVERTYTMEDYRTVVGGLKERIDLGDYPYDVESDVEAQRRRMQANWGELVWAPGRIFYNSPEKVFDSEDGAEMIAALRRKLDTLQTSLTIESAYFVIRDGGVETMKKLVDRGVHVRVLTNSLASNDVLAAHAGHAEYREALLKAGVELYELRPDSGAVGKTRPGKSRAGLHTKAFVFDDKSVFVGSFNLDPRSANINTEGGIYVESPELAAQLKAYMDDGVRPENSYHVTLDEHGDLRWTTVIDGLEVTYDEDPLSTFGQRFQTGLIQLLPVESQL